jgi:hypothetical protein
VDTSTGVQRTYAYKCIDYVKHLIYNQCVADDGRRLSRPRIGVVRTSQRRACAYRTEPTFEMPTNRLTSYAWEEELDLARRVHGDDIEDALAARNELVLSNLGLVGSGRVVMPTADRGRL